MRKYIFIFLATLFFTSQSCQEAGTSLTDAQTKEITAEATAIVKKVFDYSNNLDFMTGLDHYSENSGSYFITDGKMKTLQNLKEEYKAIGPYVEALNNNIQGWNTQVLTKDIVLFTLPLELTLKLKNSKEYTGNLVWTATLQQQNDQWKIVQSHESWVNCAEVAKALSPISED